MTTIIMTTIAATRYNVVVPDDVRSEGFRSEVKLNEGETLTGTIITSCMGCMVGG